jgi:hypothetical protein
MRPFVAAPLPRAKVRVHAMTSARAWLGLLTLSCCFAFVACGDDEDDGGSTSTAGQTSDAGAPTNGGSDAHAEGGAEHGGAGHGAGSLECQVLGELCHAADSGSGPAHDCHETGHVGHSDECLAQFDGCVETCTEVEVGSGGAGGSGADAKCAALGSLCHEAGEIDAEAQACHEVGHVGNAGECAKQFAACATLCLAVLEAAEGSVGGAGGGANGGAGGQDTGSTLSGAGGAQ